MLWIICGCIAFVFFYLFDWNKISLKLSWGGLLFFLGFFLLAVSTGGLVLTGEPDFDVWLLSKVVFFFLAAVSCFLMFCALFWVLPFGDTYLQTKSNLVVNSGLYALCRHPGVLFFCLFYVFLWLATGDNLLLMAALVWTAMDVLHVYVEDRFYFPRNISGYEAYQKNTPFLIPNAASIKKMFTQH